jgi:hypothetical protein
LKVLFITDKFGDLGNRLFRFARFYCCKPERIFICDLSFFQYVHLFSPKYRGWFLLFRFLSFINDERLCLIKKYLNSAIYAFQIDAPSDFLKSETWTCDYVFNAVKNSNKLIHHIPKGAFFCKQTKLNIINKNRLKKIFNLKNKYIYIAEKLLSIQKTDAYLVGVHIRRGDYAQFRDGELYFDDNVYLSAMQIFKKNMIPNKKIEFLLLSNEVMNIKLYSEMSPLYFGLQNPGVDQALLARCDHILGVESTFSGWISFLHDIPQTLISFQNRIIQLKYANIIFP